MSGKDTRLSKQEKKKFAFNGGKEKDKIGVSIKGGRDMEIVFDRRSRWKGRWSDQWNCFTLFVSEGQ
ncbi:hypothetical protein L2E82_32422 [Cichorium intybus]|uniref:Uncharacterized protein n=1 Tax=Cichorium intybus TaxID=13427 RepID=A0ACB9BG98_CICIN|nr:hypothetical protein L2E82_32422 [Cichorium intybus]